MNVISLCELQINVMAFHSAGRKKKFLEAGRNKNLAREF